MIYNGKANGCLRSFGAFADFADDTSWNLAQLFDGGMPSALHECDTDPLQIDSLSLPLTTVPFNEHKISCMPPVHEYGSATLLPSRNLGLDGCLGGETWPTRNLFSQDEVTPGGVAVSDVEPYANPMAIIPSSKDSQHFRSGTKRDRNSMYHDENSDIFKPGTRQKLDNSNSFEQAVSEYSYLPHPHTGASNQRWEPNAQSTLPQFDFTCMHAIGNSAIHAYPFGLASERNMQPRPGAFAEHTPIELPMQGTTEELVPLFCRADTEPPYCSALPLRHQPAQAVGSSLQPRIYKWPMLHDSGSSEANTDEFVDSVPAGGSTSDLSWPQSMCDNPATGDMLQHIDETCALGDAWPRYPLKAGAAINTETLGEGVYEMTHNEQTPFALVKEPTSNMLSPIKAAPLRKSALPDGDLVPQTSSRHGAEGETSSPCIVHDNGHHNLILEETSTRNTKGRHGPLSQEKAQRVAKTRQDRSVCLLCKIRKVEVGYP